MIALSFSRMKDLECPHRFKVLHIDRSFKETMGEPARIGIDFAEIMAEYRRRCARNNQAVDIPLLLDLCDERKESLTDYDATRELAEKAISRPDLIEIPIEAKESFLIERKFAFDADLNVIPGDPKKAWFSSKVAFRAVADFAYRLGDTLHIIDDKSGWGAPDPEQLEFYAYLLPRAIEPLKMGGVWFADPRFHMVRTGRVVRPEPRLPNIEKQYQIDQLGYIGKRIKGLLEQANSMTEFPAVVCSRCQYCQIPDCPRKGEAMNAITTQGDVPTFQIPTELADRDQAEKALAFITLAEPIIKQIKNLLRTYTKDNGAVTAAGQVAQWEDSERWSCKDAQRLAKLLLSFGVTEQDLWKSMGITKAELQKIVKRYSLTERMPFLKGSYDIKVSPAFDISSGE